MTVSLAFATVEDVCSDDVLIVEVASGGGDTAATTATPLRNSVFSVVSIFSLHDGDLPLNFDKMSPRHLSYTDSSKPGTSSVCTQMAEAMTASLAFATVEGVCSDDVLIVEVASGGGDTAATTATLLRTSVSSVIQSVVSILRQLGAEGRRAIRACFGK